MTYTASINVPIRAENVVVEKRNLVRVAVNAPGDRLDRALAGLAADGPTHLDACDQLALRIWERLQVHGETKPWTVGLLLTAESVTTFTPEQLAATTMRNWSQSPQGSAGGAQ